jgi:hypothetical protein
MSRTFTNLLTHLIFSTKDREPLIVPDFKDELYAYLGGLTKGAKGKGVQNQRYRRPRSHASQPAGGSFSLGCDAFY